MYIINFVRNCISSVRKREYLAFGRVYHHCERKYSLRLMICTFGDDIRMYISPQASYTFNDMPLLSQWIKKFDKSKLVEFFGGERGICKERSDGIAQRSGASRVVTNHCCDTNGRHAKRRKRKSSSPCVNCFLLRPKSVLGRGGERGI